MVNKVTLIGNIGNDPEIRHFEGGNMVTRFSVATNENYRDKSGEWQTRTEWHNVVVWGSSAERAERTLKKGSLVYVDGKISTRKWQDKDGNDRYNTDVVANYFRSLEKREADGLSGQSFPSVSDQMPSGGTAPSAPPSADDDLPF